jgi:hypothetical protein
MSEPDQDRELDRRIAKLPRSIRPERDLWGDIESRIAKPPAPVSFFSRHRNAVMAGASLVAVAAAIALVMGVRAKAGAWPWPSPRAQAVAIERPIVAPMASIEAPVDPLANDKERAAYRAAVSALESSFAETRSALTTDAAARLEQSIGVIDHAIEATERALASDPESTELRLQLRDEYQQKIDVLSTVVDLVART